MKTKSDLSNVENTVGIAAFDAIQMWIANGIEGLENPSRNLAWHLLQSI